MTPFRTAEEAWFWAWDQYGTAAAGALPRRGAGHPPRPCTWADIILPVLDTTPTSHHEYLRASGRAGFWREDHAGWALSAMAAIGVVSDVLRRHGWLLRGA